MKKRWIFSGLLIVLVAAAASAQPIEVETFSGTGQFQFQLPGNPLPAGMIDYGFGVQFQSIDFTPGAVEFRGEPIDFDGTEANFLVPNLGGGSVMIGPNQGGPATVGGAGIIDFNGAIVGPAEKRTFKIDLGPGFAPDFLPIAPSSNAVEIWRLGNWNSPVVPELNGKFATIEFEFQPTFVNPDLGILQFDCSGRIIVDDPPFIENVKLFQIDFLDDENQVVIPDSSWGLLELDALAHPFVPFYLNVVGDAGNGETWLVQNFPLFPGLDRFPSLTLGIDLDLTLLGLPLGDPLGPLDLGIGTSPFPFLVPPSLAGLELSTQAIVSPMQRNAGGSKIFGAPPAPADTTTASGVTGSETADLGIFHRNVPGVQEEEDACLAGAFARSIAWLNTEYALGIDKTVEQIYDDLRALNVGDAGTSSGADIAAKAKYLKQQTAGRGVTKVLDVDDALGPIEGVAEEAGTDLAVWLKREMAANDVELAYDQHIVTLTGYYTTGQGENKRYFVTYRDDEEQANAEGDRSEKTAELKKFPDGKWGFRNVRSDSYWTVRAAVSESVPSQLKLDKDEFGVPTFDWDGMGGDAEFDLSAGSLNGLRITDGNFQQAGTNCIRNKLKSPPDPLGGPLLPPPPPGDAQFFLHRPVIHGQPGLYDSQGLGQVGDRDLQLAQPQIGCPVCRHDVCTVGAPLDDPFCDAEQPALGQPNGCVGAVCQEFPSCCQLSWDAFCVERAANLCGECG